MQKIIKHFLHYPIWANMFMVAILVMGALSLSGLRTSFFPEMDPGSIRISMSYPGAAAEEIERSLVTRVENNLDGIEGIDRTRSESRENSGSITITAQDHADMDALMNDVKDAVDQVSPWPADAEIPRVVKRKRTIPGVVIVISGDMPLWTLKQRAEELEDLLLSDPNISNTQVMGLPDREIAVELSQDALKQYGLSFAEVSQAIQAANQDLSGGVIEADKEEFIIRAYNKEASELHIADIVVRSAVNGTPVRVGELAKVVEKWSSTSSISRYNQNESVALMVNQVDGEDLLDVADNAQEIVQGFREMYPSLHVDVVFDSTVNLRDRIRMLRDNGLVGLLLVLLVLTTFLNLRVAFWVALGIPISFAGMFVVASMAGITLNLLSLFAMIVVVGILVDDAIVVAEQIFQGIEKKMTPFEAASWGVQKVVAPVFTAVLTTMLAFLPFFFFEGQLGKMVWQLALVVVAALAFSLFESFFILPAHLAHSKGITNEQPGRIRQKIDAFYTWLSNEFYGLWLKRVMHHKLISLGVVLVIALTTAGLLAGGFIKNSPFPPMDQDDITMDVSITAGSQEFVMDSILAVLEERAWQYNEELKKEYGKSYFLSSRTSVGSNGLDDVGGHAGSLTMQILAGGERELTSAEITKGLRKKLGTLPEIQKFAFKSGHWGKPITVSLTSSDLDKMDSAKVYLKAAMAEFSTMRDIVDSDVEGNQEVHLRLKDKARHLGLTHYEIAAQVRQAFYGEEVQRILRGEDEIKVWVRLQEQDRNSIADLENLPLRTYSGAQVPLREVAYLDMKRGKAAIKHRDGKRNILVEADLSSPEISSTDVQAEIEAKVFPQMRTLFPGVGMEFRGQALQNQRFMGSVKKAFIPALLAIFFILILVFHSFWQAWIIFLMIPLGLIGAYLGHMFHGMMVTRMSMMGLVALTGIVINDSIVFIDQINHNLRQGMKVYDAVYYAGLNRLRPIIMTTITTVAGLAPLILETSFQAQFLIPMAISVAWGMGIGSFFILFMVPVYYLFLNSARYYYAIFARQVKIDVFGVEEARLPIPTRENVEPAWQEEKEWQEEGLTNEV